MKQSSKTIDPFTFDLLDCFQSPIIVYDPSWAATFQQIYFKQIPTERMLFAIQNLKCATDVECMLYLSTASLCFPFDHDWAAIFVILSASVSGKKNWCKELGMPEELTSYQNDQLLLRLRKDIYESRRKILKKRIKADQTVANKPIPLATVSPAIEQLKFDF